MTRQVVVVGHVTEDRYPDRLRPGGCAFYAALALHRLGVPCTLVSAWADGFCGADQTAVLDRVDRVISPVTTTFENRYEPDGTRTQWVHHTATPLTPSLVDVPAHPDGLLHLATVLDEVDLVAWAPHLRAARRSGTRVALSVQGWLRGRRPEGGAQGQRIVAARGVSSDLLCGAVDWCFCSAEELDDALADELCSVVPWLAITDGSAGARIYRDGEPAFAVGVYATEAIDPTGAGDVFAAGLLAGLMRGDSPEEAARLGAAAASVVVEALAADALPRLAEAFDRRPQVALRPLG